MSDSRIELSSMLLPGCFCAFRMTRYTVLSFNDDLSEVTNEGEVLPLASIGWAKKQLWAPDAMCKDDKVCFLEKSLCSTFNFNPCASSPATLI